MNRWTRFALATVGGGAFIAIGDHLFHVRPRVLTHHWHPQWDHQTLLVFPLFMGAAAAMILVTTPLVRERARPTVARAAVESGAFYLAYWFTGQVGVAHAAWCLVVLLAVFGLRLAFDANPGTVLLVGVLIGIGGCVGEAVISGLGLFRYVGRLVVPVWLFALYLHGAPAVVAVTRLVDLADVDQPDPRVPVRSR